MVEWIANLIDRLGYAGIVLLMFLENVFPPIPSELIMPLAGFVSGRGDMNFFGAVLAGTLGSVLGALPLYWVGHAFGKDRIKRFADRHGAWLTLSAENIDKAMAAFDRHGGKAVLLCRLVPGLRSLISIPAGIYGMRMVPFLAYTTLGTGVWAGVLAYLGRLLGKNYEKVERYVSPISYVVLGGLLLGFVMWVIRRRRQRSAQAAAKPAAAKPAAAK